MSVLFPAMLAGVVGLAGPVLLHLIARHRFPIQSFPSIQFLRLERRTNVFAWKLIDVPQLVLRLIVLSLLVLAMSRLFAPWLSSRPAPRNLVVVVDASASMRAVVRGEDGQQLLIERARDVARSVLSEVDPPSRCALIASGASSEVLRGLDPDAAGAMDALAGIEPCDGSGSGLVSAVADACEMLRGRRETRSQVVVVTDMRASAFAVRTQRDLARIRGVREELGEALDIVVVNVADEATKNVAILDAYRKGNEIQVGDDAHVIARILNSGDEEVKITPRLAIGGETAPAPRPRVVPPGGQIVMDITARMNRVVYSFAEVRLKETDALLHDNVRRLPLRVADARRVLIVDGVTAPSRPPPGALGGLTGRGDEDRPDEVIGGAKILRYVLNPGRELGLAHGTGIAATLVAPDALAAQTLSKYDVIILYDVSSLPEKVLVDLDTFVRQGRAVVVMASATMNPMRFNRTIASGTRDRAALCPAQLGNDIDLTPPSGIATDSSAHPLLAAFGDRRRGDLSVIRFTRIREVRGMADDAQVIFADEAGRPLAVERQIERGRVVLIAFGLELSRGNIARTRAFPPLAWRLTSYLAGRLEAPPADTLVALRKSVVAVREPQFAFVDELELSPAPVRTEGVEPGPVAGSRVAKSPNGAVLLEGLPAGQYLLHKPRRPDAQHAPGYARRVSVNADPGESDMLPSTREEMQDAFGPRVRIITPADEASVAPRGAELFGALMVLLILAYAAEAALGFHLSAQREKERSAEATP